MLGLIIRYRVGVFGVGVAIAAATAGSTPAFAAPPNDRRSDARLIAALPSTVKATTDGAKADKADPTPSCSTITHTVWFRVHVARPGAIVARLRAAGELDAAIAVYRRVRSQFPPVACGTTDAHGRTALAFHAQRGGDYFLLVGERPGSSSGTFRLRLVHSERPTRPPGTRLPAAGVRSTVDPVLDASDAWSVQMKRGATYRLNLTSPQKCLALAIFRPGVYSFHRRSAAYLECGGYTTFTPGPDGGGTYSLVVEAQAGPTGLQPYRLSFGPVGTDDAAPGVTLENGQVFAGRLFGRGIDVVDLYRFGVPRPHELTTLDLRVGPTVGFDFLLLREDGRRIRCACDVTGRQRLREHLPPGHYYAAVRSRDKSGGRYRLRVLIRDITNTDVLISGSHFQQVAAGVPVTISVRVTSVGAGGPMQLQLDRLDPLAGWQFFTLFNRRLDASGVSTTTWMPPSVGYWRASARFLGTPFSSFSRSPRARLHVSEPLR